MLSKYESNFYIRKDEENLFWSGLSVGIPYGKYNSYKLSCFIRKKSDGSWKTKQNELIVFDNKNNMYRVIKDNLSQFYNPNANDNEVLFVAKLSKPADNYSKEENTNIYLNELLIKEVVYELKTKTEHSFGIKINI